MSTSAGWAFVGWSVMAGIVAHAAGGQYAFLIWAGLTLAGAGLLGSLPECEPPKKRQHTDD